MQQVLKGNLAGIFAILLWATLASFTVVAGDIPPFELVSVSFFVAFLIGLFLWTKEGKGILIHFKHPLKVWLVGVGGLFGYHFFISWPCKMHLLSKLILSTISGPYLSFFLVHFCLE